MNESNVRIKKITIQNFKNVKYGSLSFENNRKHYKASVLGLYGQNGSGKTVLVDSLELLKCALCGRQIAPKFADYVNLEADYATLSYVFTVTAKEGICEVFYDFCVRKDIDDSEQNMDTDDEKKMKATIFNEVLSYAFKPSGDSDHGIRKNYLIDTRTEDVFTPHSKYLTLVGKEKKTKADLTVAKKLTRSKSRSFVFSRELLNIMRKKAQEETSSRSASYLKIIERLVYFGNYEFFIISTQNIGVISLNIFPLSFKYTEGKTMSSGQITLPLEHDVVIPENMAGIVDKVLNSMNVVLCQIVPTLQIKEKRLGPQVLKNGQAGVRVQLLSEKNGISIPFKYESEGIKKIVSILNLLIAVYNQPSVTVVIDELDSGIFEYLLGELLRIISERGKGQLIFTSHNLRPLETLDLGFVAFTSTNTSNRYVRIPNVKQSNNARSYYYRDMILGISKEALYDLTNSAEINMAFRKAGEISDS